MDHSLRWQKLALDYPCSYCHPCQLNEQGEVIHVQGGGDQEWNEANLMVMEDKFAHTLAENIQREHGDFMAIHVGHILCGDDRKK